MSVIVRDPEIMSGEPCFRGTRVPFKNLLDYLEGGETIDEFLFQFPGVTREMAVEALEDDANFPEIHGCINIRPSERPCASFGSAFRKCAIHTDVSAKTIMQAGDAVCRKASVVFCQAAPNAYRPHVRSAPPSLPALRLSSPEKTGKLTRSIEELLVDDQRSSHMHQYV